MVYFIMTLNTFWALFSTSLNWVIIRSTGINLIFRSVTIKADISGKGISDRTARNRAVLFVDGIRNDVPYEV